MAQFSPALRFFDMLDINMKIRKKKVRENYYKGIYYDQFQALSLKKLIFKGLNGREDEE
jgi:hypothetical protein